MWISSLFKRRAAAHSRRHSVQTARLEPMPVASAAGCRADRHGVAEVTDAWFTIDAGESDYGREDLRGGNAVFGLIGTPAAVDERHSWHESGAADDLIETLHTQYLRVLDDPQAPLGGNWTEPPQASAQKPAPLLPEIGTGVQAPYRAAAHAVSIEAMFAGAHDMEAAFGPLATNDAPDPAMTESVPEILRLFASAEYLVAATRSLPALPPMLARREHHALGIDSPSRTSFFVSASGVKTPDVALPEHVDGCA